MTQSWNAEVRTQLDNLASFPAKGDWQLGEWIGESKVRPAAANAAALPLVGNEVGDARVAIAEGAWYLWNGAAWAAAPSGPPSGAAGPTDLSGTYPNPAVVGLGQKIHWVVTGGKYATLQAAVTAAAVGDVIMVGPTATTWGPATFPAQKELAVYGLSGAPHSNMISVGAITFSPAAGTAQQNQLWLNNLYINGNFTGAQGVLFSGTAPGRFRMNGCFVSDSGTGNSIVSNNSGASSSFVIDNCLTDANDAVPSPRLVHTQGYTLVQDTELSGGTSAFSCAAGVLEFQRVRCEYAVAGAVGTISGGTTVAQNLFIQNTTAGGDGVLMSGALTAFVLNNSVFDVAVGAGYCVRGIGVLAYGQNTYTSTVAAPRNVKVQVPGITALPMTQALTTTV